MGLPEFHGDVLVEKQKFYKDQNLSFSRDMSQTVGKCPISEAMYLTIVEEYF